MERGQGNNPLAQLRQNPIKLKEKWAGISECRGTYAISHHECAIIGAIVTAGCRFFGTIVDSSTAELFALKWLRKVSWKLSLIEVFWELIKTIVKMLTITTEIQGLPEGSSFF